MSNKPEQRAWKREETEERKKEIFCWAKWF